MRVMSFLFLLAVFVYLFTFLYFDINYLRFNDDLLIINESPKDLLDVGSFKSRTIMNPYSYFWSVMPRVNTNINLMPLVNKKVYDSFYNFEQLSMDSVLPKIVQVAPIGLENSLDLEILPVTIWGEYFDTNAIVFVDGVDLSSRIILRTDKKIQLFLNKSEAKDAKQVIVVNNGNISSNLFNITENSIRYPDIIHINPTTVLSDSLIIIKGHNFFRTNSELYIDGVVVSKSDYSIFNKENGVFNLELQLNNSLANGIHSIYFDTAPRRPSVNYNRYKSNKLYFEIRSSINDSIYIENDYVKLGFDGNNGGLIYIQNKENSYYYNLQSTFPWRIRLRPIAFPENLSFRINPPQSSDYFNPYIGNCTKNFMGTINSESNGQKLTLRWNSCTIDSNNHFNYIQEYFLENGKNYAEMNFYAENVDVTNYSIFFVKNYITFIDDDFELKETGMQSGRGLEIIKDPAYNTKSRGGRDICYDWTEPEPADGQPDCQTTGYEQLIPAGWINTDGDGYQLPPNSHLDLWMGYWNENGDYVYAIPYDNYTYAKGYSYVGEEGIFKNTAVALYPDTFDPENFDYKPNYKYRIGVGKGTKFIGEETWINIADVFKKMQQELGMLNNSYSLRNIPEHVRYLDLSSVVGLDSEFFDVVNGQLFPKTNPNSSLIAKLFETSRKYFGADEATLFIWGGELDRTRGLRYEPISGITFPFLEKLNDAGWNPCFYSVNGALQIQIDEAMYLEMIGQETEFDPTGEPVIVRTNDIYKNFTMLSAYSTALGEGQSSYLKWFIDKYRVLNNNGKGMKCFYSDGIFSNLVYGSGGPWSEAYNQNGWDDKALPSFKEFFKKEFEELRKIDNDTYTFHEAASQFSTDEGLFPVQAGPGGIITETSGAGTQAENGQSIQFYQRVWGGYQDFILSNEIADPNLLSVSYIPESFYSVLKNINDVNQNYNKTLEEAYLIPGVVGFLYKGAIPFYVEPGVRAAANYTSIVNFSQAPLWAVQDYWYQPLQSYAEINRELVQARQLARNYFHGLWHPGVRTDSFYEDYYYINDVFLFLKQKDSGVTKVSVPRVISSVRQPWGNGTWENKYGIMFINTYLRESEQTITFDFDFDRYGAVTGLNYNLFKYSKESGREYLGTYNNDFSYEIDIPSRKFVLLELEQEGDMDGDGVNGREDICPNTEFGKIVNSKGCPVPQINNFSPLLTSNLMQSDELLNYRNFSVGIENVGRIEYLEDVRLLRFNNKKQSLDELNISDAVNMEYNNISVNVLDYPELNLSARVTIYGLSLNNPLVLKDGDVCRSCFIESYNSGQIVFRVSGFSEYSVIEGVCGDNYCSLGESCSSCSNDCGLCSGTGISSGGSGLGSVSRGATGNFVFNNGINDSDSGSIGGSFENESGNGNKVNDEDNSKGNFITSRAISEIIGNFKFSYLIIILLVIAICFVVLLILRNASFHFRFRKIVARSYVKVSPDHFEHVKNSCS